MTTPASDSSVDCKALVRDGYNKCAQAYVASRRDEAGPELSLLIDRLPSNATMLDIGCGGGIPVCQDLARHGSVIGIDISAEMIALAERNVPTGEFRCEDIMTAELGEDSFDAVTSFYAIFHLPKHEHEELRRRIHAWLKPRGHLMITLSLDDEAPYTEDDFLGVTMYWSNFGISQYREMRARLGFTIVEETSIGHGYRSGIKDEPEVHPLILAQKK